MRTMRISDLIRELTSALDERGDIEVSQWPEDGEPMALDSQDSVFMYDVEALQELGVDPRYLYIE